jgi:hypothetical protein
MIKFVSFSLFILFWLIFIFIRDNTDTDEEAVLLSLTGASIIVFFWLGLIHFFIEVTK